MSRDQEIQIETLTAENKTLRLKLAAAVQALGTYGLLYGVLPPRRTYCDADMGGLFRCTEAPGHDGRHVHDGSVALYGPREQWRSSL